MAQAHRAARPVAVGPGTGGGRWLRRPIEPDDRSGQGRGDHAEVAALEAACQPLDRQFAFLANGQELEYRRYARHLTIQVTHDLDGRCLVGVGAGDGVQARMVALPQRLHRTDLDEGTEGRGELTLARRHIIVELVQRRLGGSAVVELDGADDPRLGGRWDGGRIADGLHQVVAAEERGLLRVRRLGGRGLRLAASALGGVLRSHE